MNAQEKFELITQGLQEVVGEEKLKKILAVRNLKVYWGTAPTGKPHVGYFVPIFKIGDLLKAGCEVIILFADIHAYLDNMKSSWELLEKRTRYYEFIIREMLSLVDVPLDNLKFVQGTEFQLAPEYTLDMYKMSALTSTRDTKKAGAEVVKQLETPKMSNLLYPILQALDEEYLKVDAQFGGVDQRKIFVFAREFLPRIGYEKRVHLMNPLVPGLGESGKMSSSEPNSKIDFEDSDKTIRKKINKAFCADKVIQGNGLLALLKLVLFKYLEHHKKKFVVTRPKQYGGTIEFESYDAVESAFAKGELSSIDLKSGVADALISFLEPLKKNFDANQNLFRDAYPQN